MRFNYDAYEKVFPETTQTVQVDSAIDTFKPTEESLKATDNKPGELSADPSPEETKAPEQIVTTEELPGETPEGV